MSTLWSWVVVDLPVECSGVSMVVGSIDVIKSVDLAGVVVDSTEKSTAARA